MHVKFDFISTSNNACLRSPRHFIAKVLGRIEAAPAPCLLCLPFFQLPILLALFSLHQARVTVYKSGNSEKVDASGSDNLNWFSVDKLISSPWTDVKTETRNFFSLQGHCRGLDCRSFFINRNDNGCENDAGWLLGSLSNIWCPWETTSSHKYSVLYSKLPTFTKWSTVGESSFILISGFKAHRFLQMRT